MRKQNGTETCINKGAAMHAWTENWHNGGCEKCANPTVEDVIGNMADKLIGCVRCKGTGRSD